MSTDPMAEIRASFFIECEELMENLQDALLILDEGEGDAETVNVVFRAVHSIKGGAGAFGFSELVGFAHRFETVLDQLRAGKLDLTPDATKLFFQGADLLHDHIRAAQADEPPPAGAEDVLSALEELMGGALPEAEEETDFTPSGLGFSLDLSGFDAPPATAELPVWTVDFTPRAELYASGNETTLILRALCALGEAQVSCHVPEDLTLTRDGADQPRLSWTIRLQGEMTEADIREVFDFVTDVCTLTVTPAEPGAGPAPPHPIAAPAADETTADEAVGDETSSDAPAGDAPAAPPVRPRMPCHCCSTPGRSSPQPTRIPPQSRMQRQPTAPRRSVSARRSPRPNRPPPPSGSISIASTGW